MICVTKLVSLFQKNHFQLLKETRACQISVCVCFVIEFLDSKGVELFENVPELKKTFVIQSKIGEGRLFSIF